ncbi:MAG TPA: methyltransferase domain-containing protein [Ilumatobacteraceae bacterium]|nr:methyltransferase domain-containing protein [Ilumatobacteraceae bacterium]HRB02858.1 methyltransferase domain-containing protein [Ilumatobacteraceae bacterium]
MAIEPVLAELDEARRALAPSGVALSATLLGQPVDDTIPLAFATRLGLPLDCLTPSSPGLVASLLEGFGAALAGNADVVVSLDADGQHDARQIPDLVRSHLAHGSGLTIGSRWTRGGTSPGTGVTRTAMSRVGNELVKAFTGARGVSDSTTSFRVYSPEVVQLLLDHQLPTETYGFFCAMVAIIQAHGFAVDEVPIVFRPRYSGAGRIEQDDLREFAASLSAVRRQVHAIRREMRSNQALWAQRNPRLRAQASTGESVFGATEELTQLADATHFLDWICESLAPHLGQRVLEVGAGVGAIATTLAAMGHDVTAIEPADNVFPELQRRTAGNPRVEARKITSGALLGTHEEGSFDSVVYVSVLEHIRDDVDELKTAWQLVRPGGTVALFVPAMPSLYGSLDFKSGHFRRYDKALLETVLTDSGFELLDVHYMDVAGVVPYFVMYRLLDVPTLDAGSSKIYDSMIVPVSRFIQNRVGPPAVGKNLLAVARRPLDWCPPA